MIHLFLGLASLYPGLSAEQIQARIVDHGFGGWMRHDKWAPITIEVTNAGPDFDGSFHCAAVDWVDGAKVRLRSPYFERPVSLPSGSAKRFTLYVFTGGAAWQGQVKVLNSKGKGVWVALTPRFNAIAPEESLVLTIGLPPTLSRVFESQRTVEKKRPTSPDPALSSAGDPKDYTAIEEKQLSRVLPVDESLLPDHWVGYESADLVVLSSSIAADIREIQGNALSDWVAHGGTLLVCDEGGGAPIESTWLNQLLPVRLKREAITVPAGDFRIFDAEPPSADVTIRATEIVAGRALARWREYPLLAERVYAAGRVVFFPVDLRQAAVLHWLDRQSLLPYLLQNPMAETPPPLVQAATNHLAQLPELQAPPFWRIGLFLLISVIVIGPVNYLYLARRNRKEWAFATVPLLSLLFAVSGFYWARGMKGGKAILNQTSLVCLNSDSGNARRTEFVGFFASSPGEYGFGVASPTVRWGRWQLYAYNPQSPEGKKGFAGFRLSTSPDESFSAFMPTPLSMTMWSYETFKAQDIAEMGALKAKLTFTGGKLEGELRNETPYALTVQTVQFGSHVQMSRRMDLPSGSTTPLSFAFLAGENVTEAERAGRGGLWLETRPRQKLYKPRWSEGGPYALIHGTISGPLKPSFQLRAPNVELRSNNYFYTLVPVDLGPEPEFFPPGCIPPSLVGHSRGAGVSFSGYPQPGMAINRFNDWFVAYIGADAFVEFSFRVPAAALRWKRAQIDVVPLGQGPGYFEEDPVEQGPRFLLEVWNPTTKEWQSLTVGKDTLDLSFMNPADRKVRVRVKAPQGGQFYDLDIGMRKVE